MKKKAYLLFYILVILLVFTCLSCTYSIKRGYPVRAGVFEDYYIDYVYVRNDDLGYDVPIYEDKNTLEDFPEFNFKFKITIEEIPKDEYEPANGLNVLKDLTYRGKNRCYRLEVMLGYSYDNLQQIDFIYDDEYEYMLTSRSGYPYDRGELYFHELGTGAVSTVDNVYRYFRSVISIRYEKGKTYNNESILDNLGYDYIDVCIMFDSYEK